MENVPLLNNHINLKQNNLTLDELIQEVTTWRHAREELIRLLREYKDELVEINKKVNICKVAGTSTSIVGGVLTIIGLALIPVTLGSSLAISIAGGVIGGVGGITSGGPAIYEHVKQFKAHNELVNLVERDTLQLENILKSLDLIPSPNTESILERLIGNLAVGTLKAVFQAGMVGKNSIWNIIVSPAIDGAALARTAASVGRAGVSTGVRVFGIVVSSIMLPIDIASLALTAKDIHQKNIPEICSKIDDVCQKLQDPLTQARDMAVNLAGKNEVDEQQISRAFLALLALEKSQSKKLISGL